MAGVAAQGAAALAASDAPTALSAYTQALIEHPSSPDYFVQRSIAFTRLKPPRHDLALKDAEYAVLLAYKRAKRDKIQAAQHRRVVALYGLGRYADAMYILTTMERWRPDNNKPARMEGDMWMARLETKLKTVPESEQLPTTKECPEIELPSEGKLKEQLKAQLNADGSYKFDQTTDVVSTTTPTPHADANANTNATATTNRDNAALTPAQPTTNDVPKIRHEWYQNAQSVTITLYAKGVSKDSAEIDVKEDSLYISFPHPANASSTFTFSLDPLFALIDPSQSKSAVMSTKIELTLKKVQQGQKWRSLEGTTPLKGSIPDDNTKDDAAKAAIISTITNSQSVNPATESSTTAATTTATAAVPVYPTSSRHGPKNWDKLANDLHSQYKSKKPSKSKSTTSTTKKADSTSKTVTHGDSPPASGDEADEDIDSDYDSADPVDGFFKKLYAGADADTRRAMMKSFYESKGTALSTNWSEVGQAPVEEVKSKSDE
ncbi:hypothetical protein A1O3_00501 [Capronia epimyces CBS 606.96]|uniref:CS domain-containing protein n=1 Tax=Capronia epimyces CBS 606.96 TaxID=1182542 RepID=W9YRT0_9EURO|nr:uncharacterized protein A1O3_00501 [Capronia epimyces CBS 606.96]EXJ91951.1 hypothetical protein A1O3_00501 [Capronia epimyces CBS 606.96]